MTCPTLTRRLLPAALALLVALQPAVAAWSGAGGGAECGESCCCAAAPADDAPAQDTVMGLVQAPGFELVLQNCITCHGPRQFLQQRGDRDTWRGLIRWMQRDHGLRALEDDVEDRIVDYLATNYGPEHGGRRRPLPPDLMPPNPYATK